MGKSQKSETSYQFDPKEGAAYLRRLADRLEEGRFDIDRAALDLEEQVKIKKSIKEKPGRFSIKVKVKMAGSDPSQEEARPVLETAPAKEPGPAATAPKKAPAEKPKAAPAPKKRKPSFKRLKKKMGGNYRALKAALREESLPESGLAEEFLDQCRRMVAYPGKGDPYFEDFGRAAEALAQALAQEDREAAAAAVAELDRLRKNCHRRFK